MNVGLCLAEIHLTGSHSLKEKRRVVRRLKDQIRARFNIAVAEVDHQDLWQRATLGIVAISTTTEHVEQSLAAAMDEIDRVEPGLVTRTEIEFLT